MKKFTHISIIVVLAGIVLAFATPEKRIEKLVSKVWKKEVVELYDIALPDSLKKDFQEFKQINVDGVLEGYAVYTTAFGCRVGGCAAPGNANVQAYETFDYIVIYDINLDVVKIDIANYGGDYGYEICNPRWLAQFIGSGIGFKLNENIDGIAGATVSASYLIDDLNHVGSTVRTFLQPDFTKL